MTDATPAVAPPPAADSSGLFDDLVEVLFTPAAVFARRRTAGFGGAMVIIWLVLAGLFFVARPVMRPILDAQMEKAQAKIAQSNPALTPDQKALAGKIGNAAATTFIVVGPLIAMLLLGVFLWIIALLFGGKVNAGQGMLIATYAFVPRILGGIAIAIQGFLMDLSKISNISQVSIGPSRFFDPASTSAAILAVLGRFDVFVLWSTVVIAVGYRVIGRMSAGAAYGAAFVVWALALVFPLLGALRGG